MIKYITYFVLAGILTSCYFFKKKEEISSNPTEGKPVARVFNNFLYEKDLEGLFSQNLTADDSLLLRKRYINSWVKKQVLLMKAESNILSLKQIEDKVNKYRYDLILFEYQRKYLDENLDNTVSEEEIQQYYENNKKDFELKKNIVKCEVARLHKNTPKLDKNIKLFKSTKSKDQQKFKEYVMQYSDYYKFEDDVWYDFNEVVSNTPFVNYQNQIQFLKKNKFAQETDSLYVYFIKIIDYKINDEISPLEFVKDRIADIIINKRKVELIQKLEEGVVEIAQENNDFEIF